MFPSSAFESSSFGLQENKLPSAFDQAQASVGLGGFFAGSDVKPSNQLSLFDSLNPVGGAVEINNSNAGNSATQNFFNIRAQNQGNLSITDKMRGIQGNRLDMDEGVSIAEMYADTRLDTRVGGGQYNVTLSNIYQDEKLYKAYHGLFTDGKITERENYQIDMESMRKSNSDFAQGKSTGGLEGQFLKQNSTNNKTNTPLFGNNATTNNGLPAQQFQGGQPLPGQQPAPPPLTPLQKTLQPREPVKKEAPKDDKPVMTKEEQIRLMLNSGSLVDTMLSGKLNGKGKDADDGTERLNFLRGNVPIKQQNPFEKAVDTFKEKIEAAAEERKDAQTVLGNEESKTLGTPQTDTNANLPDQLTNGAVNKEGLVNALTGNKQSLPSATAGLPNAKAGLPTASAGVKAIGATVGPNGAPNVMEQRRLAQQAEADKKNAGMFERADEIRAETDLKKAIKWALNPVNRNTRNPYITKENYEKVMEEVKKARTLDFSISEEDKNKTFESMKPQDEKVAEAIKEKGLDKKSILEQEKEKAKEKESEESEKQKEQEEQEAVDKEVDRITQIREAQAKKKLIEEREENEKKKKRKKQEEELKKKPIDFSKTQTEMLEDIIRENGGIISFSEVAIPGETTEEKIQTDLNKYLATNADYEALLESTGKTNIRRDIERFANSQNVNKMDIIKKLAEEHQKQVDLSDLERLSLPTLSSIKRRLTEELENVKDEDQREAIQARIHAIQKAIASKI